MRPINGEKLEQKLDDIKKDYEYLLASNSGDVRAFECRHLIMFIKSIAMGQPAIEDTGCKQEDCFDILDDSCPYGFGYEKVFPLHINCAKGKVECIKCWCRQYAGE